MDYILCMHTFQFLVCLHVQEKNKKDIPSEWFEDCAKQKKKFPVELESIKLEFHCIFFFVVIFYCFKISHF